MTDTNDNSVDTVSHFFAFTEQTYVEAIWFVAWKGADWMGAVYRDTPESPWRATYRFRYYVDDLDAFESQDRKSGAHMRANEDDGGTDEARARMVAAMEMVAKMTTARYAATINWRGNVQGSAAAALTLLGRQSFGYVKVMAPEPGRPQ